MLNHLLSSTLNKSLNVVIVESNKHQGKQLSELIKTERPHLKVLLLEDSEQVFSLMYGQMNIDILFFDVEAEANADNIALVNAILPQTSLIHWSDYQHPEVIELLYSLGVNFFCTKESDPEVVLEALDLAANYPQSLYLDRKLHQCLPLLSN
ncbi:response regulator transcription factor [Pleurocapsales cyanobacterium LEGE 10410]|nr:response regulator transcription factor [Pleurocapsales cyanobacterium LEGE 10410]